MRTKKAAGTSSGEPSVRAWLEARLAKGELSVADAKAFVESTGRSAVTMYRQAKELGYGVQKGVFVADISDCNTQRFFQTNRLLAGAALLRPPFSILAFEFASEHFICQQLAVELRQLFLCHRLQLRLILIRLQPVQ